MDRTKLLIIIGGVVLITILSFVLYDQVEEGVPAEKLIPQIDRETENLKIQAKKRLEKAVMDRKYWGDGDLATSDDYNMYITSYEFEMKIIVDYENARKKFARREITKREFLSEIRGCKEFYSLHNIFQMS